MLDWLMWLLAAGAVAIAAGTLAALVKIDRRWRPAILWCCRCQHSWIGLDKLCPRCQGRGRVGNPPPRLRVPTHDWQGYLDTVPIPEVRRAVSARSAVSPAEDRGGPVPDAASGGPAAVRRHPAPSGTRRSDTELMQ